MSISAGEQARPVVQVSVTFAGLVQVPVGRREHVITLPPGATLGVLLQDLTARFGPGLEGRLLEDGDLAEQTTVLINGRNALSLGGLAAKLGDGCESHVEIVVLGPPLMGG